MKGLETGDIYWVNLDPTLGTEQAGRRPALVISDSAYNNRSNRVIVCPVTSRVRGWPMDVALPGSCKTEGVVLCDQVRALDRNLRLHGFIEKAPIEFVTRVQGVLGSILGFKPGAMGR